MGLIRKTLAVGTVGVVRPSSKKQRVAKKTEKNTAATARASERAAKAGEFTAQIMSKLEAQTQQRSLASQPTHELVAPKVRSGPDEYDLVILGFRAGPTDLQQDAARLAAGLPGIDQVYREKAVRRLAGGEALTFNTTLGYAHERLEALLEHFLVEELPELFAEPPRVVLSGDTDLATRLRSLHQLVIDGILTDDEFQQQKRSILDAG